LASTTGDINKLGPLVACIARIRSVLLIIFFLDQDVKLN